MRPLRFVLSALALAACGGDGEAMPGGGASASGAPEKTELRFGFIKLTDMVPLAVALEKGFFEDEGLFVELEAQARSSWMSGRTPGSRRSWSRTTSTRRSFSPVASS